MHTFFKSQSLLDVTFLTYRQPTKFTGIMNAIKNALTSNTFDPDTEIPDLSGKVGQIWCNERCAR